MKQENISILIANYNNGNYFADCYTSLINQTSTEWEAIVIDDCSTDDSVHVILSFIKNDPRFRFFQNEHNIGYQQTTIKGIQLAETSIFARLDPDDALAPKAIERSLAAHREHPEVGLVYSNFVFCDQNLIRQAVHKAKQIDTLDAAYLNFNGEISHFASFKKHVYALTAGIDPFIKRAEDKDIYMKMCEIAPVKHLDEELYLYRIHDQGASTNSNTEKALFWHWVALIKMSERRNLNLEDLFGEHFVSRPVLNRVKKSKWAKLGHKIGLFKAFKHL